MKQPPCSDVQGSFGRVGSWLLAKLRRSGDRQIRHIQEASSGLLVCGSRLSETVTANSNYNLVFFQLSSSSSNSIESHNPFFSSFLLLPPPNQAGHVDQGEKLNVDTPAAVIPVRAAMSSVKFIDTGNECIAVHFSGYPVSLTPTCCMLRQKKVYCRRQRDGWSILLWVAT